MTSTTSSPSFNLATHLGLGGAPANTSNQPALLVQCPSNGVCMSCSQPSEVVFPRWDFIPRNHFLSWLSIKIICPTTGEARKKSSFTNLSISHYGGRWLRSSQRYRYRNHLPTNDDNNTHEVRTCMYYVRLYCTYVVLLAYVLYHIHPYIPGNHIHTYSYIHTWMYDVMYVSVCLVAVPSSRPPNNNHAANETGERPPNEQQPPPPQQQQQQQQQQQPAVSSFTTPQKPRLRKLGNIRNHSL